MDQTIVWAGLKAVVVYLFAVGLVRVGALRLIGRLTSLDVLVAFILGSLLSRGITGSASLGATMAASACLVAAHWLMATITYKSQRWARYLKRSPLVLVKDGRLVPENLKTARVSEGDLLEGLRQNGTDAVEKVKCAYLERNGEISVVEKEAR
jgi:uncharacterized membrane protein YcaP (DUF421 family)